MSSNFRIFGPIHLLILGSIPAFAGLLVLVLHLGIGTRRTMRLFLAAALILNSAVWYGYLLARGWLTFPGSLPLELCDLMLCLTIAALLTLNTSIFDVAYYGTLAGTSMALLTPDLWEAFPSFSTVQFFIAHGLVVATVLFLVWTGELRPRPGSVLRAMLALNVFAAFVGGFNVIFGTNYMYLRTKPANPSLLDYMGPWPWYILSAEGVAIVLFTLLWLPFKVKTPSANGS